MRDDRTTDHLADLIAEAIDLKRGNKEFALFYTPNVEPYWMADIGNPASCVMLGEAAGEVSADGATPVEAVQALIRELKVRGIGS